MRWRTHHDPDSGGFRVGLARTCSATIRAIGLILPPVVMPSLRRAALLPALCKALQFAVLDVGDGPVLHRAVGPAQHVEALVHAAQRRLRHRAWPDEHVDHMAVAQVGQRGHDMAAWSQGAVPISGKPSAPRHCTAGTTSRAKAMLKTKLRLAVRQPKSRQDRRRAAGALPGAARPASPVGGPAKATLTGPSRPRGDCAAPCHATAAGLHGTLPPR